MSTELISRLVCAESNGMMLLMFIFCAMLFFRKFTESPAGGLRRTTYLYGITSLWMLMLYIFDLLRLIPAWDHFVVTHDTLITAIEVTSIPLTIGCISMLTRRDVGVGKALIRYIPFILVAIIGAFVESEYVFYTLLAYTTAYSIVAFIVVGIAAARYTKAAQQEYSSLHGRSFGWLMGVPALIFALIVLYLFYVYYRSTTWLAVYEFVSVFVWAYFYVASAVMMQRRSEAEVDLDRLDAEMLSDADQQEEVIEATSAELESFREELRKNCEEPKLYLKDDLTREDLAAAMHTNHTYLTQRLVAATGSNFYTYINRLRIAHAESLMLEHPDWSLDAIAYESGYRSRATFNSAFKRILGDSPTKWRKK